MSTIHTCGSDDNGNHIKGYCCRIEELEKELDNARFIIERAYFDTFDPFHRKLELARIDWLNNNKRE